MRKNNLKAILKTAVRVVGILPLAAVVAFGAQQVNLTAGPTTTTMPDGTAVPMWGYSCGTAVGGSTATCAALNKSGAWSPVIITVPTGQDLTINLKNLLTFSNGNTPGRLPGPARTCLSRARTRPSRAPWGSTEWWWSPKRPRL